MSPSRPTLRTVAAALLLLGATALTACDVPPEVDGTAAASDVFIDPETGQRYDVIQGRPVAMPAGAAGEIQEIQTRSAALVAPEGTDWSGKIHVQIFTCYSPLQNHPSVVCNVDSSYVVVGGGAQTNYGTGAGALLTETRPSDDKKGWVASSKDHGIADLHELQVFAVGMRIDGVARDTLLANMQVKPVTSTKDPHPQATATTDEGFLMIGGGARVNYTGQGNLLTRSSPALRTVDERSWLVSSKDHRFSDPATITAYVIGIKPTIPGFGAIQLLTHNESFNYVFSGKAGQTLQVADTGWVTTCPGGLSDYFPNEGRLLTGIVPTFSTAQAMDKDHLVPSDGRLYAFVRQIRKAK